jgi:hypothetical protein
MNGSRVALGAARDTSQSNPSTSADPSATNAASAISRRVRFPDSWRSDTLG